jgi:hypothetical protein
MNIYTNFWEEQLLAINKRIKTSEATEYVVSDCGIDKLGSRDSSGYDGSVSLWMGEIDSPLRKAVFRDFAKALNKENKNLLSKAIGRLEVRIRNNSDLHVSYEPISFESILDKYEELQQKDNYLSEEIYKWELTKAFQDQWKRYESNEISFKDFFGKISFKNLAYHMCIAIYNHILREKPDEFEKLITYLFDERIDLQERIIEYRRRFDELYFSLPDHGANTYEEERTIATLLAFRYPEKYTFYKDNFYSKLCKGLGIEAQKPVYKLAHYYALVENFRTNHLTNRITLIQKNKATLNSNCDLDINNLILSQDILYTTLVSQIKSNFIEEELDISIPETLVDNSKTKSMKQPLNQILYGPPGTGKTYNSINRALMIIDGLKEDELNRKYPTRELLKKRFDELLITDFENTNGQIAFTTFHQSMSYEDFIEGIKPLKPEADRDYLTYDVLPGIFKQICDEASRKKNSSNFESSYAKFVDDVLAAGSLMLETPTHKKKFQVLINSNETAVAIPETEKGTKMGVTKEISKDYIVNGKIRDWKPYTTSIGEYIKANYPIDIEDIENSTKPYVLIIDEINRGNVSKIFGELITLIEESKRVGKSEALKAILPYSKDIFSVPDNVYIVGTMNTADRSVEALDTALRRRFEFVEMMPDDSLFIGNSEYNYNGINVSEILKTLNKRIEVLLGRDHQIGHSFFILNRDESGNATETIEQKVYNAFIKNIIPLLQEYFYGDYNKIGLVLGSGFVKKVPIDKPKDLFADNSDFNGNEYVGNESTFSITNFVVNGVIDYVAFSKAIETLMNKSKVEPTNE